MKGGKRKNEVLRIGWGEIGCHRSIFFMFHFVVLVARIGRGSLSFSIPSFEREFLLAVAQQNEQRNVEWLACFFLRVIEKKT